MQFMHFQVKHLVQQMFFWQAILLVQKIQLTTQSVVLVQKTKLLQYTKLRMVAAAGHCYLPLLLQRETA